MCRRWGFVSGLILGATACGGRVEVSSEGTRSTGGTTEPGAGAASTGGSSVFGSGGEEGQPGSTSKHPAVGLWMLLGIAGDPDTLVEITTVEDDWVSGRALGAVREEDGIRNGSSSGQKLSFYVPVDAGGYWAELTAAKDGSRMTGEAAVFLDHPDFPLEVTPEAKVTLLRFPDELESYAAWKKSDERRTLVDYRLNGTHILQLVAKSKDGNQFSNQERYSVRFNDEWLAGDLGVFHWMEMTVSAEVGDPIQVGPVAPTETHLPVEMELRFDDGPAVEFSGIWLRTASDDDYMFEVVEE